MIDLKILTILIICFSILGCAQQSSLIQRNTICNFSKYNFADSQNKNIDYSKDIMFLKSFAEPDAEYLITNYDKTLSEYIDFNEYLNWQQIDINDEFIQIYESIYNKINYGQSISEEINTISSKFNTKYVALNFIKKFDPEVANIENVHLPIIDLLSAKTLYRNGFISNLKIYDSKSTNLVYDLDLISFSDDNENRFSSDDSLYIDKTISNLMCELYYFPKFIDIVNLSSPRNKFQEKIVLSEILDEYLNKKRNSEPENAYYINHILDNSLAYFMSDKEIVDVLEKLRISGVIREYSFNHRTTNLPGFSTYLNPKFFE